MHLSIDVSSYFTHSQAYHELNINKAKELDVSINGLFLAAILFSIFPIFLIIIFLHVFPTHPMLAAHYRQLPEQIVRVHFRQVVFSGALSKLLRC